MSGNGFDSIAHALLAQKQRMDGLQAENHELRRQLADLRTGHGIFVEIAGMRFPARGEILAAQTTSATNVLPQNDFSSSTASSSPEMQVTSASENEKTPENEEIVELDPTQELSPVEEASEEQEEQEEIPTFLEEIMIDEFTTASTSPMAVWQGPIKNQQPEQIGEEQKAALRRELMGSFLLE